MSTRRKPNLPGRRLVLRVTNPSDARVLIRLEPWAREIDLLPDVTREFVFTGPDPADIEIELMPAEVTIYGWTGSILDGIGDAVPPVPTRSGDIAAR